MSKDKKRVFVTVAIGIDGDTKVFEAEAETPGDAFDLAKGLLDGIDNDAHRWLNRTGREVRGGY